MFQCAPIRPPMAGRLRGDLLELLRASRHFLRRTARDLTDGQAAVRSTVSALCIAGLINHVTATEQAWAQVDPGASEPRGQPMACVQADDAVRKAARSVTDSTYCSPGSAHR